MPDGIIAINLKENELMINLDANRKTPLYEQLYEQIKQKIISGEYPKGTRLTSTRKQATDLCIGRNTVENAYDQLCVEGYIKSRQGSGYIVMDVTSALLELSGVVDVEPTTITASQSVYEEDLFQQNHFPSACRIAFRYGEMDYRTFPHTLWRKATAKVLSQTNLEDLYSYGDKQGEMPLRKEITRYLRHARGVRCSPEQIVLGSGFQDLIRMTCLLLKTDRATLAMEEPGYDFTRILFQHHGYAIAPVNVNSMGMDSAELQNSEASLAYVTPSYQLPMGVTMPIQQRMQILQWARKVDGTVIEDDYDSELRYRTRPIPSLQSIDKYERVIYLGTFSKAFAPGLRMGYMVLPSRLLPAYHQTFERYKSNVSRSMQFVAAEFMISGQWEKHLRKISLINKKKRDILVHTIQSEMGDRVTIHGQDAGLHILLELNTTKDNQHMVDLAAQHGVMVSSTQQFWYNRKNAITSMVMLGFGGLSEDEIVEGIKCLRHAWFD